MTDDERFEAEALGSDEDGLGLQPNRREVVVGLAAGAVVGATSAQAAERLDVRLVRNPARHDEFGVAIDYLSPGAAERTSIVLYPRTFSSTRIPKAQRLDPANKNAAVTRYVDGVRELRRFGFEGIRFSDRGQYDLEFTIEENGGACRISASFDRKGQRGQGPKAKPVDLADFASGKKPLVFNLDLGRSELFRWDLFGERLEVAGQNGARLSLFLDPPRQPDHTSPWAKPQLLLMFEPNAGSTIWALKGAVTIKKIRIEKAKGDEGDGARIQEDQELAHLRRVQNRTLTPDDEELIRLRAAAGGRRADAWLGAVEGADLDWRVDPDSKDEPPPPVRYRIGAVAGERERPELEIVPGAKPTRLSLRQWGQAHKTLVMLRAPLNATILSPGKTGERPPPAVFYLADAMLTRQDRRATSTESGPTKQRTEEIEETLTGRLQEKAFALETCYGTLTVEGDPPPQIGRADAKEDADKQADRAQSTRRHPLGVRLHRRDDFAFRPAKGLTQFHLRASRDEIRSFDARALLRHMSVALPNARTRQDEERDVPAEDGRVWSRLGFNGTEIAFRLHLPGIEQNWPSARGVVTLGEGPRPLKPLREPPMAARRQESKTTKDDVGRALLPPVTVALDGAHLRVRRDSDNLALSFQFARMALELGHERARIVPNLAGGGAGSGQAAAVADTQRRFDDRPLLIVHFPPQHVAEKAYYRQVNDGLALPDVPSNIEGDKRFLDALDRWRQLPAGSQAKFDARKDLFNEEKDAKLAKIEKDHVLYEQVEFSGIRTLMSLCREDGGADGWRGKVGADEAALLTRWEGLPKDQRAFYLGPSARAMDPDARKVWLAVWRAYVKANPRVPAVVPVEQRPLLAFEEALFRLPDVDVAELKEDLEQRLPLDASNRPLAGAAKQEALDKAILAEKKKRSREFTDFMDVYERGTDKQRKKPELKRPNGLPAAYQGRDSIRTVWQKRVDDKDTAAADAITAYITALAKLYEDDYQSDPFLAVTPARLSGPSRLVFRFDTAGGTFDDRDQGKRSNLGEDQEQVRSIDFSLEGLTDWGRFDLAVARRAETLELLPGGRVPHPDLRAIDLDPARILAHQGIRPGRSIEGRFADIQASLQPPGAEETAIELPFRLILSPDQFGRFRTRRPIDPRVFRVKTPEEQAVLQRTTEKLETLAPLWSANLQIGEAKPVVRAIWSDDFRPQALGAGGAAPIRGPHAPWAPLAPDPSREFRTGLDAYDRHEIVALSSAYGLPVMGRRNDLHSLIDASQFEPPAAYKLRNIKPYQRLAGEKQTDQSGIYNPSPLDVTELRLTALGGSLRHDTAFTPPASAIRTDAKPGQSGSLFEAFSVERWRQITVLGRDIEVEVVYRGFLFPLGVRAALVKLTERRFVRPDPTGPVTAYLIQRQFIRIGRPDKAYPAVGQPDRARAFPVAELRMLTRETPDIVDPNILAPGLTLTPFEEADLKDRKLGFAVRPNGKIDFGSDAPGRSTISGLEPGLCFWPRTRPGMAGNIAFEFRLDGQAAPLRMPLVFVDNVAANNTRVLAALAAYYNWDRKVAGSPDDDSTTQTQRALRTVEMGGARRRYADENQDGECTFETSDWEIKAEGRANSRTGKNDSFESDPLLQGSDQPPFYPFVKWANIRIGQAERFVGRSLGPRYVKFEDEYRKEGFPSGAAGAAHLERYLELRDRKERPFDLDMGEVGDRSGGIGRPAMQVGFLSRRYGLMPNCDVAVDKPAAGAEKDERDGAPPPAPKFNLMSFFSGKAKLLGLLTFEELLRLASAGSGIPELKEKVDAATEDTAEFLRQSVLPEIERALKSLEEMWETAQRKLSEGTQGVVPLNLDEIYPDIAPALAGLIGKVKRARAASNAELVAAMTEVQASGRKFVTAISRTLSDPIAPLREDLSQKFRTLSAQFHGFGEGLGKLAATVVNQLVTDLKAKLKKEIEEALVEKKEQIKPFTRLIFALPLEDALATLSAADAQQVADCLDAALVQGAITFIGTILSNGKLDEDGLVDALNAGLAEARKGLDAAKKEIAGGPGAQAEKAIKSYEDAAKNLADDFASGVKEKVAAARKQLLRQVPGPLYPLLFDEGGIVPALQAAAEDLRKGLQGGGGKVLDKVAGQIGIVLKNFARTLIQREAEGLCRSLVGDAAGVGGLTRLLDATLPSADAANEFLAKLEELNDLSAASTKHWQPAEDAVERYRKIRGRLTAAGLADFCGADQIKSALSAQVARELRELVALRDDVLEALQSAVVDFAVALSKTDKATAPKIVGEFIDRLVDFIGVSSTAVAAVAAALTELETKVTVPPTGPAATALNRAVAAQLAQLKTSLGEIHAALETARKMLEAAKAKGASKLGAECAWLLVVALNGTTNATRLGPFDATIQPKLDAAIKAIDDEIKEKAKVGAAKLVAEAEKRLLAVFAQALAAREMAKNVAIEAVGRTVAPILAVLKAQVYDRVRTLRDDGNKLFPPEGGAHNRLLQVVLRALRAPGGGPLTEVFYLAPFDDPKDKGGTDRLADDIKRLDRLIKVQGTDGAYTEDLVAFADGWEKGTASPLALLGNLLQLLTAVLRGDLAQFIDLHHIRREVDQAIRSMVPARIKRSYDLDITLGNIDKLVQFDKAEAGLPKAHPKGRPGALVLRATGVVDVLQPQKSTFEAEGYLPGFALQLLPSFDVVTFTFPPTSFTAGLGKPFNVSLKLQDVQLGSKVQFLKKIESILPAPKNGSGFFMHMMTGRGLGIVAGYRLPISPITIGNMYIDNISLNAAAELPFDDGDARFVISVSRPESPFMIAVAPYAGAGHFGLIANTKGIIGFEASFQFGGGGGFAFGPLTGQGRISVGVYVRKISGLTELYGTFYAGGSARIACFGVGAQLYVRLSQSAGDLQGEAIFTYSFSVGVKDIEFSVTVFKREKGSGEESKKSAANAQDKIIDLASDEYREVFAQDLSGARARPRPVLSNETFCKGHDFGRYRRYFVHPGVLAPGRRPSNANAARASSRPRAQANSQANSNVWVMP